jgi:RsmE family RNA methyltransferase
MNLLLLDPTELTADGRAVISGPRVVHVRRVLGLGPGDRLRAGVVDGPLGEATVESVEGETAVLRCESLLAAGLVPSVPRVDLLLALPRPKVMGRLWPQLSCLGVRRVMLCNAARVERFYFDSHVLDAGYFRPRLLEGLSQACDTRMPQVSVHRSFRKVVEDELGEASASPIRLLTDVASATVSRPIPHALAGVAGDARVLIAVGPEGGWVDFERDLFSTHGFVPVSLGARTLRSDLACIVAVALAHESLGRTGR